MNEQMQPSVASPSNSLRKIQRPPLNETDGQESKLDTAGIAETANSHKGFTVWQANGERGVT